MLAIVILNFLFYNSNIVVIFKSGSDDYFVSSNCVFLPFGIPYNLSSKAGHVILDDRN